MTHCCIPDSNILKELIGKNCIQIGLRMTNFHLAPFNSETVIRARLICLKNAGRILHNESKNNLIKIQHKINFPKLWVLVQF